MRAFISVKETFMTEMQVDRKVKSLMGKVVEMIPGAEFLESDRSGARVLGDIGAMLESEALILGEGFENDPICNLVSEAANIYGIQKFEEDSLHRLRDVFPDEAAPEEESL